MQETLEMRVQPLGHELPLEEEMAWWATVHGVTKSLTRLSTHTWDTYKLRLTEAGAE